MRLPSLKNKSQIEKLLLIEDPRKETIYGVVGRMEVLMDYFLGNPSLYPLVPFLKTYYFVTKKSADKYVFYKHYFYNLKDYETLDVYFASLYFEPLLRFLEKKEVAPPWQHYFDYCQKIGGIPFLQIILGINAHINSDLYKAIVDLKYSHVGDFFLVNKILKEVAPDVIKFLAMEKDLVGIGGLVFKDLIHAQFENTILKWRSDAWINSRRTTKANYASHYESISENTEKIAVKLTQDFASIYSFKNIPGAIREVNSLSVNLI
jgi:hypothetical protein